MERKEELEELSKSEKRRVRSLLEQIIRHLLMDEYWQSEREYNKNHWEAKLISFRDKINLVALKLVKEVVGWVERLAKPNPISEKAMFGSVVSENIQLRINNN